MAHTDSKVAVLERFEPYDIEGKQWGTETVIAHVPGKYLGKLLKMRAGFGGAFQYHEKKDESFYLLSGKATVRYKNEDGAICEVPMLEGDAYHVPCGAAHQVTAETDCVFVETSLPVFEDRKPA